MIHCVVFTNTTDIYVDSALKITDNFVQLYFYIFWIKLKPDQIDMKSSTDLRVGSAPGIAVSSHTKTTQKLPSLPSRMI